jgi:hypothetical protein
MPARLEQLPAMVNQQGFLEALVDGINQKTEGKGGPLIEERKRPDRRLRQIYGQSERYLDVLGELGTTIPP